MKPHEGRNYGYFQALSEEPQRKRKPKSAKNMFQPFNEDFPGLPAVDKSANEPKYILCSCTPLKEGEAAPSLSKYNPFLIQRALNGISSGIIRGSFIKDGNFLMVVNNKLAAEKFLACKVLTFSSSINSAAKSTNFPTSIKVTFRYHPTLNNCKGVIYLPLLKNLSNEEITEGLSHENVVDARHITKKTGENTYINTGAIVLTFNRFSIPSQLIVCFTRVSVREYVQNPMRCAKCQLLGHTKTRCSSLDVDKCHICSKEAGHNGDHEGLYCFNCKSDSHSSSARNCPKYLVEKEVLRIINRTKCSRYEARKRYFEEHPSNPVSDTVSFAKAALELNSKTSNTQSNTIHNTIPSATKLTSSITKNPSVQQPLKQKQVQTTSAHSPLITNQPNNTFTIPSTPTTHNISAKNPSTNNKTVVKATDCQTSNPTIQNKNSPSITMSLPTTQITQRNPIIKKTKKITRKIAKNILPQYQIPIDSFLKENHSFENSETSLTAYLESNKKITLPFPIEYTQSALLTSSESESEMCTN